MTAATLPSGSFPGDSINSSVDARSTSRDVRPSMGDGESLFPFTCLFIDGFNSNRNRFLFSDQNTEHWKLLRPTHVV